MASPPWYTYPHDQPPGVYGSYPDPVGPYPKPDVNVCVPGGLPITALLPGTVTSVTYPSWSPGQPSVTIKLDSPINNLATHTAYNYLGSATVQAGMHINAGQTVGYAKGTGICTAFALTADDVYGDGTFMQYAGNPLLNPMGVLNAAINGTLASLGNPLTGTSNLGVQISNPLDAITSSPLWQFISDPMRPLKMLVGIMLIGIALVLMLSPEAASTARKVAPFL